VGRRLIGLNFQQQRFEADFRFSLVRLRENAEGVALYHGEASEQGLLRGRFGAIMANWWELMRFTKHLTFFNVGYNQIAIVFPFLVSAPRYFAGEIALGGLTQIAGAFGSVSDSLSWFVNNYGSLTEWKASVDRLLTFHDALDQVAVASQRQATGIRVQTQPTPSLRAEGLSLALPNGRPILSDAAFTIERGDHVLVSGPSGTGKSTLFRAMAGIWPFGEGMITVPEGSTLLFLPQKPYIPISTLRDAVAYPATGSDFGDDAIREALGAVQLSHVAERLDETRNWSMQLSGGEQQRLAIARALLHRPDWLFMDEATSALDSASEERVSALLHERLTDTTMVSVSHRPLDDDLQTLTLALVASEAGTVLQAIRGTERNGQHAVPRREPATAVA
jgi:putative ATP-binding cassette transporter